MKIAMRALIVGYYGAKNLGDDMMLFCLLRWLANQQLNVTVVSENPLDTQKRFNVKTILNTPLLGEWAWYNSWFRGHGFRLIRAIQRNDLLIVGGGDLIRDDRGWRIFWYTMEKIFLAILLGKPIYLVNIGIGRPTTRQGHQVLKWALRRCGKIIVRDQRSLEICNELGCGNLAIFIPDIVLELPKMLGLIPIAHDREKAYFSQHSPYILVCLRGNPNVFDKYPFDYEQIKNFASVLDSLVVQYDLNIMFLPFECGIDEDNNSIQHQIIESMSKTNRVIIKRWTGDFTEVVKYVRDAHLVIAMRLHAAVLAVALKKKCVIMPYDFKLKEFSELVGLKHTLSYSDINNISKMLDCFEQALSNTPTYLLQSVSFSDHVLVSDT